MPARTIEELAEETRRLVVVINEALGAAQPIPLTSLCDALMTHVLRANAQLGATQEQLEAMLVGAARRHYPRHIEEAAKVRGTTAPGGVS